MPTGAKLSYIPNTSIDRAAMLSSIGEQSVDGLFDDIPLQMRHPALNLPPAISEMELRHELRVLSERNLDLDRTPCFLGAGLYHHYVPATVGAILSRGEFYTSYTPYQPEISQGVLQTIYEFQTLVCQLTGMEVANASMYDGATALAEAAVMAINVTGRRHILIARSVHPEYRAVLSTYSQGLDVRITVVDIDAALSPTEPGVAKLLHDDIAALLVQQPNFFGCVEDLCSLAKRVHSAGALLVVAVDPIALGLIQPPGECDADIVVAEGQSLGNQTSFGGPLVGLFACRKKDTRQMPGRLVGATTDRRGGRGFVLTLQTREQHIRREHATSNICTNEALNALAVTVYLSTLGPRGLRAVANLCTQKAHYAAKRIAALPGYSLHDEQPFFKEFVVRCPASPSLINSALLARGIVGGYELGRAYPELADCMLFCVTEMNAREQIDRLVESLQCLNP